MILEQDVALLELAEPLDPLELALFDRGSELGRMELVFEHPGVVQIVIDPRAALDYTARRDADPAGVPLARGLEGPWQRRRQHVVERRGLAMGADLRVGVTLVVDQLIFVADRAVAIFEHEVLQAAVPSLGDLPLP